MGKEGVKLCGAQHNNVFSKWSIVSKRLETIDLK